jgi:hypothetical protein
VWLHKIDLSAVHGVLPATSPEPCSSSGNMPGLQDATLRFPARVPKAGADQMIKATPIPDTITRGPSGTLEWATCEGCDGRVTRTVGSGRGWWHLETKRITCLEKKEAKK